MTAPHLNKAGPRAWIPSLQSLRGLAALAVVLYHITSRVQADTGHLLPVPGLRLGWLGVDLFFVLSAFLLARPFLRGEPPRYAAFVADRFLRIAPAYYAAVALSILVILVFYPENWDPVNLPWTLVFQTNLSKAALFAVNPVFWTLAVEMQFYLILPWLARVFAGRYWLWALAACVGVSTLFRALTFQAGGEAMSYAGSFLLPSFLGHFAIGLAASRLRQVPHPGRWVLVGLALILGPSLLWIAPQSTNFGFDTLAGQVMVRPIAAAGFGLLVLAGSSPGAFARGLSWAPLRRLGDMSYSLYLMHITAFVTLYVWVPSTRHPYLFAIGGTLVSLLAGAALHVAVELPVERWRHARKARAIQATMT